MVDAASVAVARQHLRTEAARLKLPDAVSGSLVNIASELGHNQLAHARRGKTAVRAIERACTAGLEIIAVDGGPGIVAPSEALHVHFFAPQPLGRVPGKSLGIGLAAVVELADETDFDVRIGEGTCIRARKFARAVPHQRQVGIYGRPYPGEQISGDHACFVRNELSLLVGLVDGLGHGPFARIPTEIAMGSVRQSSLASVERIVEAFHDALGGTRGAVIATARIDETYGNVDVASVGNVAVQVYGPQFAHRFADTSFVLGARGQTLRPAIESKIIGVRDVLIMFSDGLPSRLDLDGELESAARAPYRDSPPTGGAVRARQ